MSAQQQNVADASGPAVGARLNYIGAVFGRHNAGRWADKNMNNLQEKYNQICRDVGNELLGDIHEYVDLFEDSSCLDGWFTAKQLRCIADAMYEVSRRYELAKNPPNNGIQPTPQTT